LGGSIPISPTTLFDEVPALGAFFISGDPKNSWETSHDSVCGDWQNSPQMMLPDRAAKRDLSTLVSKTLLFPSNKTFLVPPREAAPLIL
jgi:hypothetical protein